MIEAWGYSRVYTPTFEFYDALAQADGHVLADILYRFVDREGATLALRPEMTIPIARMVATGVIIATICPCASITLETSFATPSRRPAGTGVYPGGH